MKSDSKLQKEESHFNNLTKRIQLKYVLSYIQDAMQCKDDLWQSFNRSWSFVNPLFVILGLFFLPVSCFLFLLVSICFYLTLYWLLLTFSDSLLTLFCDIDIDCDIYQQSHEQGVVKAKRSEARIQKIYPLSKYIYPSKHIQPSIHLYIHPNEKEK